MNKKVHQPARLKIFFTFADLRNRDGASGQLADKE